MPLALSVTTYAESHDLNAQGVPFFNHLAVEGRHGLKQHNPVPGMRTFKEMILPLGDVNAETNVLILNH